MTMMIALVGEQPLPNFLPIRHYCPREVLFIYTSMTRKQYAFLEATLQKDVHIYGLETDPYDMQAIATSIDEKLNSLSSSVSPPLIFNLTGGTKTMSLAAYQVALQRSAPTIYVQSEKKQTRVYHYSLEGHVLRESGSELLPENLHLQDVFDLHLGPGNWYVHGAAKSVGGLFEDALATSLKLQGYEVMVGVKSMDNQLDIDLAIRWGNQYGIIEAKAGQEGCKFKGIQQLNTAKRCLGTYAKLFYVITVSPEQRQRLITEALRIEVISLPGHNATAKTLSPADEKELLGRIDTLLKE